MSAALGARCIDHVLIERGRVAERWRTERWDSLRLLTPNWMTRLPGMSGDGPDPSGFMGRDEVVRLLDTYRTRIDAPVLDRTRVIRVATDTAGYRVTTDRGDWRARAVVIATGACDRPLLPGWARALPGRVHQVVPEAYRRPEDLPPGGVLVVGASATGVQLAAEIHASLRPVTLAVGSHARLPRSYRGRDIMEWMHLCSLLDQHISDVRDPEAARRQPSLQLIGRRNISLDLPRLARSGVSIVGRATGVSGARVALSADLGTEIAAAERRRQRLLARIDTHVSEHRIDAPEDPGAWETPAVTAPVRTDLDLRGSGIRTVLWATGYRRDYSWLDVPVLDAAGELRQSCGVTPAPGLYALGLRFQCRRNSSFLGGVGRDAEMLAGQISRQLNDLPLLAA